MATQWHWNKRMDRFLVTARGFKNPFADIASVLSVTEGQRISAKACALRYQVINHIERQKK